MPDELEEFVLACTLDEEFFSEENNMLAMHTDAKSSSQAKWIDNWAAIPEGMHTVYFTFMKDSEQMGRAYVDQLVLNLQRKGSRNRSPCLPRRQKSALAKSSKWVWPRPLDSRSRRFNGNWMESNPGCHKSGLSSGACMGC